MAHEDNDLKQVLRESITTALDKLFAAGAIPQIVIDGTCKGVIAPDHILRRFGQRLPIDLRPEYPLNIVHTEEALEVDLAFSGDTWRCVFPWRSIYSVRDFRTGAGIEIEVNKPSSTFPSAEETTPQRPSGLRLIKGGKPN